MGNMLKKSNKIDVNNEKNEQTITLNESQLNLATTPRREGLNDYFYNNDENIMNTLP